MRSWNSDIFNDNGIQVYYWSNAGVTANSRVVASITEVGSDGQPFIGKASLSVFSVAPNNSGEIWVEIKIDWGSKIDCRLTFFVDP